MPSLEFFIDKSAENVRPEIEYTLKVWGKNQSVAISIVAEPTYALSIGVGNSHKLQVSKRFAAGDAPQHGFDPSKEDLENNLIENAFRMINSHQETDDDYDELGRFKFVNSYQHRLGNVKDNLVQKLFNEISFRVGIKPTPTPTRFFLSHDIDLVNSAIVEDGFNVFKKGRLDLFLKMIFNLAIGKPEWLNMDKIMKLESEYDCRSIFFWIVNQGKINKRERNADYDFHTSAIQSQFAQVENNSFENGIHKSLTNESFADEFTKYGSQPLANRYHYLKFNLPIAYDSIDAAGLKLDSSLGFAEEIGFRNSYGTPFNPYNLKQRVPYTFLEAPLHVMDRTFFQYKKLNPEKAGMEIFEFFEKNRQNCVLSILWHNNFFTDYKFKGYLDLYKKILAYIKDNNFKTISAKEIVKSFSIVS